jgi:hypothetical protein
VVCLRFLVGEPVERAMVQNVIQEAGAGGFLGEDSLAPSQIAISARVSVSFELTD